jgi:Uri superfamily endonuclease
MIVHAVACRNMPKGMMLEALESQPGTYALVIRVHEAATIRTGHLGAAELQAGYYVYLGSALGPGGLRARIGRHLRQPSEKRLHWHIDSLTAQNQIVEVWWAPGSDRQECAWAAWIAAVGELAMPGFGSSDCRCPGHLYWLGCHEGLAKGWSALHKAVGPDLRRTIVEISTSEGST